VGSGSPYFKFVGRRRGGVVVVKNVCGKSKVFPVSDWKDLKREADENGEYFENYLRDAMWSEMCVLCVDVLKCRFASGLPDSPFDLYRVSEDKIVRI
jgi:hypothetical protein